MSSTPEDSQGSSTAKKTTSSVEDTVVRKAPFGSRFLKDENEVWNFNAWDHVPPPDDQGEVVAKALEAQRTNPVPEEEKPKYHDRPSRHWDNFYKMNNANFFKNRRWLNNEFPELIAGTKAGAGPFTVAEIGCGAGNSAYPLLSMNENPDLRIFAYDYSPHAVKLVQRNPVYENPPIGSIQAAVWDLTSKEGIPSNLQEGTVDVIVLIFVMSALHPDEWLQALGNIYKLLKPGGLVVLRDYGRYDLAQLRFKANRLLDDNFYIRGDKTRVYFFELDELSLLFTGKRATAPEHASAEHCTIENEDEANGDSSAPTPTESLTASPKDSGQDSPSQDNSAVQAIPMPEPVIHSNVLALENADTPRPLFTTEQLGVDRRLLVNRKRQLKMYRVWMQGQFRKPS
ncbi:methyltransferase [Coprinellus micaceus]|uniref:tRNA N(3)-methylcytidine methyltransferase n=1 Tax=Coprinellus micaceus TaxID=71717 RepID=A0A4Y7TRB4_COPMI|nr:methyltransferase [Coprinellus micaceus]